MLDFTFLDKEYCCGKDELDYFKEKTWDYDIIPLPRKRGAMAEITDFAVLLGGFSSDEKGYYYLGTKPYNSYIPYMRIEGECYYFSYDDTPYRYIGVRPALSLSSDSNSLSEYYTYSSKITDEMVIFGYYPQDAVSLKVQLKLDNAFIKGKLQKTGNYYTSDSREAKDHESEFLPQKHIEYIYKGKRYVRVKANLYQETRLSNYRECKKGEYVWVEVSPIEWIFDYEKRLIFSEKILFAGVPFKNEYYYQGNFENTVIKKFMDNNFSKEILQAYKKYRKNDVKYFDKPLLEKSDESHESSVSNLEINLETAIKTILSATENNEKIELHTFDKRGKQKVYTIKNK